MIRVTFLLSVSLLTSAPAVSQVGIQVPPEVVRFVEPGTTAIALEKGDVNGDGKPDYLLVLERLGDDGQQKPDDIRGLLVLVRQKTGELKLVTGNKTILGCAIMQGAGGSITVTPMGDGFDVEDHFGSGTVGGTKRFKFTYIKAEQTWVLVQVDEQSYADDQTPPEHIHHLQKPYENGRVIRFAEFKGAEFSVDCAP
jgi:hypothetical protein